jgi:hypothetical protein
VKSRVVSSWAVGAGLLALATYFVVRIVVATFHHLDFLLERAARSSETRWHPSYPTGSVVWHSVWILVEAFILWVALTQARATVWRRTLSCGALAFLASFSIGLMTPTCQFPAVWGHVAWLFYVAVTLIVTALVAGVVRFVRSR